MRARFFQVKIEKENMDTKYRVCSREAALVGHLTKGCSGLAQREYSKKHGSMGLIVYWELCHKYEESVLILVYDSS